MSRYFSLLLLSFVIAITLIFGVAMIWFIIAEIAFINYFREFQAVSIEGRFIERSSYLITFVIAILITRKKRYLIFDSKRTCLQKIYISTEVFIVVGLSVILAFFVPFALGHATINMQSNLLVDFNSTINQIIIVGVLNNLMISLGEEIVYRGLIFSYLLKKTQQLHTSVVISSLVFSVLHINYSEPVSFLLAFIGGGIFAYAFYYSKTLLIPVVMHFSYNFFMELFASENQDYLVKILETEIFYIEGFGDLFAVFRLFFLLCAGGYVFLRFSGRNQRFDE